VNLRRVLGVDPGPTHNGWALLDFTVSTAPLWHLGGTCGDELEDVFDTLDAAGLRPDLVCVERPRALHNPMANVPLMATAWAGGIVVGIARARGLDVLELGQNEWRLGLVGHSAKGERVDPKVEAALRLLVRQLPARTSVHARDAAGVACVGYRAARRRAVVSIGGARGV
jgi:Holliday junction resolvasome RuvABC endonuclease subunit